MRNGQIKLKSPDEINRIGEAGIILSDIFKKISKLKLDGLSTWELDSFVDDSILKKKARAAFKTVKNYGFASCISLNNEVIHGIPSKKRIIKKGDIIKVDIGIALNGYFCDSCSTFAVGNVTDKIVKLINTCKEAIQKGVDAIKPGGKIGDIGNSIQMFTESCGFSIVKEFAGHGVGYALHEQPLVPHYGIAGTGLTIEEGLVIAVEPAINEGSSEVIKSDNEWTVLTLDGKLSAQFEHTIAVTKNGPVILTA